MEIHHHDRDKETKHTVNVHTRCQADQIRYHEQVPVASFRVGAFVPDERKPNDENREEQTRVSRFKLDGVEPERRAERQSKGSYHRRTVEENLLHQRFWFFFPVKEQPDGVPE